MHVFTYGSLMFPAVWTRVVGGSYRSTAATLTGFRRQRVHGEDYPCLGPADGKDDEGAKVQGVLYLDVAAGDVAALDAFEGEDYRRIEVPVTVGEGKAGAAPGDLTLLAQTYVFVALGKIEPGDWDPVEFERDRIERFLRTYPPARAKRS